MILNHAIKFLPLLSMALAMDTPTSHLRSLLKEKEGENTFDQLGIKERVLAIEKRHVEVNSVDNIKKARPGLYGASSLDYGTFQTFTEGVIGEGTRRHDRGLQTDSCYPFSDADDVPFDETGETITIVTGNTVGEDTSLLAIPDCVVDSGAPTSWYRFAVDADVGIGLTTCSTGTTFDTTISVFRHSDDETGCFVYCLGQNDDHGIEASFCSPSPEHSFGLIENAGSNEYYVAVSGQTASDQGRFELVLFAIFDSGSEESSEGSSGTCEGPTIPNMACNALFTKTSCSACDDTSCPDFMNNCETDCGSLTGCNCALSTGTCWNGLFGSHAIECSGTTNFDCGDYTTEDSCGARSDLGCSWVPGESESESEEDGDGDGDGDGGGDGDGDEDEEDCPLTEASPIVFDPSGTVVIGNTVGAPANLQVDGSCGNSNGPTLWYSFRTTGASRIALLTCSALLDTVDTTFDTVLSVYTGSATGGDCETECVAENDDHGGPVGSTEICDDLFHSVLIIDADAFTTYYVAVSGYTINDSGDFVLIMLDLS